MLLRKLRQPRRLLEKRKKAEKLVKYLEEHGGISRPIPRRFRRDLGLF